MVETSQNLSTLVSGSSLLTKIRKDLVPVLHCCAFRRSDRVRLPCVLILGRILSAAGNFSEEVRGHHQVRGRTEGAWAIPSAGAFMRYLSGVYD